MGSDAENEGLFGLNREKVEIKTVELIIENCNWRLRWWWCGLRKLVLWWKYIGERANGWIRMYINARIKCSLLRVSGNYCSVSSTEDQDVRKFVR
jgi:hypothetical protein